MYGVCERCVRTMCTMCACNVYSVYMRCVQCCVQCAGCQVTSKKPFWFTLHTDSRNTISVACGQMSVTSSVRLAKKHHATGPTDEPPLTPDDFPDKYRPLRCKFCKMWSTSLCPWCLDNTPLSSWYPVLPWARGKRDKPIGDRCKLCVIVAKLCKSNGLFLCLWGQYI